VDSKREFGVAAEEAGVFCCNILLTLFVTLMGWVVC
jgi:hypothetical protein